MGIGLLPWLRLWGTLGLLGLALVFAPPASAAEIRTGDTVIVGREEIINDDLYAAGTTIIIDGSVNGDVFAAGQRITISGLVSGSVSVAARTVSIAGTVKRSVRMAGQDVSLTGNVAGDVLAAGQVAEIARESTVGGDLLLAAATANVGGTVARRLRGGISQLTILGSVGQGINVETESLTLAPTAKVGGDLNYTSQREALIQPGAQVKGQVVRRTPETPRRTPLQPTGVEVFRSELGSRVAYIAILFLVGAALLGLLPGRVSKVAGAIRAYPWASLGWGLAAFLATPVAVVLATILFAVVIGIAFGFGPALVSIPLALIGLALYGIVLYVSPIFVGYLIGQLGLDSVGWRPGRSPLWSLLVGLIVLVALMALPWVGWLVGLAVVILGPGALAVSWITRQAIS